MAKVELKAPIIEEIKEVMNGSKGSVIVDYRGLTVAEDTELRKQLRAANVKYKVYKNTYIKRAIAGTEYEKFNDLLEGPTALAVSKDDATAPARILAKFAKRREAGKTYEYKSVEDALGKDASKRDIIREKRKRAKKNANSGNKTEFDKWKSVQRKQDNRLAEEAEAKAEVEKKKKS